MIISIKGYFEELFSAKDAPAEAEHTIELATAVLMIEISLADDHGHEAERRVIADLLLHQFKLDAREVKELVRLAEAERDHAVSLHDFVRLLNEHIGATGKARIIENLWRIAYADAVIDKYEEYSIRKLADLLHVPHSQYIKAKHRAAGEGGPAR